MSDFEIIHSGYLLTRGECFFIGLVLGFVVKCMFNGE